MSQPPPKILKFTTHSHLRHRLLLATLTGTPIFISSIRSSSLHPGLTTSESSFLRLLDSITNGSHFEISVTGTTLLYKPGLITGNNGKPITHVLPETCTRGVTYFLEPLALLAPFSKSPFSVTFTGGVITSATKEGDASVDTFRAAFLPPLTKFGIERNIECRVLKRSCNFPGAGEVSFVHGHQVRLPPTLHMTNPGRVKRIRGVAYSVGVSANNNARMIEATRGVLNPFIPDVYIFSDVARAQIVPADYGKEGALARAAGMKASARAGGKTRKVGVGFGLSLVAETSLGGYYCADAVAEAAEAAEDVGRRAAWMLLQEVEMGGCVGRYGVLPVLTFMMMGVEGDVGRLVVGKEVVTGDLVEGLRDLKRVFGVEVGLREADRVDGGVHVSVVGRGVGNVGRKLA